MAFVLIALKGTFERDGSIAMIPESTTTSKLCQSKHLQAWNKKACTVEGIDKQDDARKT